MGKNDLALICVVHDPSRKLVDSLTNNQQRLKNSCYHKYIAVSDRTHPDVTSCLRDSGFVVEIIPKNGAANARRNLLKIVLQHEHAYYHYCDLDRFLAWIEHCPDELEQVQDFLSGHDYVIIGRTEKAFGTHPVSWIETEKTTNRIFSMEFGADCDITAGSCWMSRWGLVLLAEQSHSGMTDAEWPLLIRNAGKSKAKIGYIETNGLLYTSKNASGDDVSIESWFSRVRLMYSITRTIEQLKNTVE